MGEREVGWRGELMGAGVFVFGGWAAQEMGMGMGRVLRESGG